METLKSAPTPAKIITTQVLEDVVSSSSSDRVPIVDIVNAMESVGFGLVMMIFSFGLIIPMPPPFPSIISAPLVLFSSQMVRGFSSPKLPKRFSKLSVKRSVLASLVQKSSPWIRKVERILRPRLLFMTTPGIERIVGFFALLFSSFVLVPAPLSNFVPGLGVLIISFGLISKDGLAILIGIFVGISGVIISTLTCVFGISLLKDAFNFLKNLVL